MDTLKRYSGVTLIEVLLVLAIGALVLTLALQQYDVYSRQSSLQQVKRNAEQLLIAASQYYRGNCMNIGVFPVSSAKFNISIQQLINKGFLTAWAPDNPLVDGGAQEKGYFVQFIQKNPATMNVSACWNFTGIEGDNSCQPQVAPKQQQLPQPLINNPSTVIFWIVHVAVKIADSQKDKVSAYAQIVGADCTSDSADKCNSSADQGTYLIWERLPSFSSPEMSSTLWQTMPLLKQFNMQYTHDLVYELETVPTNYVGSQYYLCGG
ncbi:hypothetical protein AYO45_04185 [Gammaproteobacteria bacterium SCGC AG-212-F23]|nr:hypothetical protein AYO45_04185 [Gammaproteobacteria bacterium SCGC AG-212-F23]